MLKPLRLDIDPISDLAITLSDWQDHLRIDTADEDGLLLGYIQAAIETVENLTHRSLIARTHRWTLANFPQTTRQEIRLPRGKTQSVASIQYTTSGSTVTLTGPSSGSPAGTDYQESLGGEDGGVLMPSQGESWPSVDHDAAAPVVITFTAGWTAVDDIPHPIRQAMRIMVATWDRQRDEIGDGTSANHLMMGAQGLLSGYALNRWY